MSSSKDINDFIGIFNTIKDDPIIVVTVILGFFVLLVVFVKLTKPDKISFWAFTIEFRRDLKQVERDLKEAPGLPKRQELPERIEGAPTEVVRTTWDDLQKKMIEILRVNNITPDVENLPSQVERLLKRKSPEYKVHSLAIGNLYGMGLDYIQSSSGALSKNDATQYQTYVTWLIPWLDRIRPRYILLEEETESPEPPKPVRRATQAGSYGVFKAPSEHSPTARLMVIKGPLAGHSFDIEKPEYMIGREGGNDLAIEHDDSVSGRHARLHFEGGSLYLRDEKSTNGTYLNGNRLKDKAMTVALQDEIRIGATTFRLDEAKPA